MGVDAQVTVEVLRFEADGNGNVTLEARWQLLAEGGKKRISDQRTRMTRNSRSDYSQVVGAMNELLTELSQKISSALVDEFPTQ